MKRIVVLAAGLAALVPAPSAGAATLSCGAAVDQDVVLDQDLVCLDQTIEVVRDGVTVDLAGHTVSFQFGTAIASEGNDHVTIRNGTIQTEGTAVRVSGSRNRLEDLAGFGDQAGLALHDGDHNAVIEVALGRRIGAGATLTNERADTIAHSTFDGGVFLGDTRRTTIRHTAMGGLALDAASRANRILDDDVRGDNPFLRVAGDANELTANRYAAANGLEALTVTGDGNLLRLNEVTGSPVDGIDVVGRFNWLRGNVARRNGQLGIDAAPWNFDLGGNRASDNGDARQCVGVRCTP